MGEPSGPPDPELLGRFLAGECSAEEAGAVRSYLAARPHAARAIELVLTALEGAEGRPEPPSIDASWEAVRRRMHGEAASEVAPPDRAAEVRPPDPRLAVAPRERAATRTRPPGAAERRVRRWRPAVTLAASVLLGVGGWFAVDALRPTPPPSPPRVYETAAAQRAELLLSDGTRVRIAPASRVRVAADYGEERRDVWLEGEAFFDVVHDEAHPFTVYAGNATARDLGTEFAVRSYAEDRSVQVVVREGEVALSGVGRLSAGDVGRLDAEGAATVRRAADVEALLGWLDGRHDFRDAPLAEVLRTMHRWYGVHVQLADSALSALPFTGTLGNVPPRAAIELVAATLALRVGEEGGAVRLERVAGRTPGAPHAPHTTRRTRAAPDGAP